MSDREIPLRNDSRSSQIRFFSDMEQRISQQFSGDNTARSLSKSDGSIDAAGQDYSIAEEHLGNEDNDHINRMLRNSFDMPEHNKSRTIVRPKSSGTDTSLDALLMNPTSDMGHLSRRIWMGSDDDTSSHERSFGVRNTFNRSGFRSHRIANEDSSTDLYGELTFRSVEQSQRECSISSNPIVVSPYMVSKFISSMIHQVIIDGVTEPDRISNCPSPDKYTKDVPRENWSMSGNGKFELTSDDYSVFKRNAGTVVTSEVNIEYM